MNSSENNNSNINTNVNVNPTNGVVNQNTQTSSNPGSVAQAPTIQNNVGVSNNLNVSPTVSTNNSSDTSMENSQTANNGITIPENVPQNLTATTGDGGAGSVVNEKLKEVEINYTPPSKFKTAMTVLMFIFLIAFVIFLPEITSMVNQYKANKNKEPEKIITSGKLECSLKSNTSNLDTEYLRIFKFEDSKLYEANYTLTTKGDVTLDEKTLDQMADKCELLAESTNGLDGVTINCNYSEGKLEERQNYVFATINYNDLDAAFTEAGGTYPEFSDGQDISTVEKAMNAAGYSCTKSE